jgi:hypothetical protein
MMLLESFEREDHVLDRHRLAVVPLRLAAQPIGDGREIGRVAHRFRQQPVLGRHLVECLRHQLAVDERHAADERTFDAGDRHVEIVKGAEPAQTRRTGLGRSRVDVVEMLETGGIFELAEQRQAVPPFARRSVDRRTERGQPEPLDERSCGRKEAGADDGSTAEMQGTLPC